MKKIISGNWRIILVIISMTIVFGGTYYKWTVLLHTYGNYGSYVLPVDELPQEELWGKFTISYFYDEASPFEKETIYREAIKYQYWVAFWKIWTFDAFVFISTALILLAIQGNSNKKE